jgi:hypothetical protein
LARTRNDVASAPGNNITMIEIRDTPFILHSQWGDHLSLTQEYNVWPVNSSAFLQSSSPSSTMHIDDNKSSARSTQQDGHHKILRNDHIAGTSSGVMHGIISYEYIDVEIMTCSQQKFKIESIACC